VGFSHIPTRILDLLWFAADNVSMVKRATIHRAVDGKGRVVLGERFANRTVLIQDDGAEVRIRVARVVPEDEAWLWENPAARESLKRGVEQAARGEYGPSPDLKPVGAPSKPKSKVAVGTIKLGARTAKARPKTSRK
jgi:hypothetical protein